ncbi:DUF499 domain-containing protein [Thermococcus sp.]|uniref:DUF499 domain-containing protein n=1 Tax=Thermococcus sp. TaxID=35749 RepID=UPI002611D958|nr:DUF499 domain-containing protein [Thermococcus sp.]MCD6143899.1 DUF499 domain-containing protein [Thermococcus sp.]
MSVKLDVFEIWDDVMDESLDKQVAPEVGDVVSGKAHKIYTDPREFFRRTYFTDSMLDIFERLLDTFEKGGKNNIFLIYSLFGGGKTHTIIALYHAFKDPDALLDEEVLKGYSPEKRERVQKIAERLKSVNIKILPIYGKGKIGQPSNPLDFGAYKVKTVWGYLGHSLGKYYLVEPYDNNYTAPDVDTLRELFKGQKILLLVDEIAHHVDNLYKSGNEDDRRYAGNVAKFLDVLGTALIGTDSAMALTLPMEKEGEKVEKEYDKEVVLALWQAVTRVGGAELHAPLRTEGATGGEIVEVLKKRIFRKVEGEDRMLSIYRDVYSNEEVFGKAPYLVEELSRTYPFHPQYIAVLRTIVERGKLQKTRDVLRITRIVVRKLVREFEDTGFAPSLIMSFQIDPRDEKLKGLLFGKNRNLMNYSTVLDVDLAKSKFEKFSNPELAEVIVRYIFLATYPYNQPRPLPNFPTKERIARVVYEHNLFEKRGWLPTDIVDIVNELKKGGRFIYLNIKDEFLWFWHVANVSQMVEAKTSEILEGCRGDVLARLEDYIARMVFKGTIAGKRKKEKHVIPFFKKTNIVITSTPQEFHDSEDYKLQILVREASEVDTDTLWNIIYKVGVGTRTYKNTIVVCYLQEKTLETLLEKTARVMACEEVKGDIKAMYQEYGEDVVEIQTSMVKQIQDQSLGELEEFSVGAFVKVAYPYDDKVSIIQATPTSKSIVQNVYDALVSNGKIAEELSFDGLAHYLKEKAEIDLEKSTLLFGELRRRIRSNSRLPMIADKLLKEAVIEGVKDLRIGIKRGEKVLFKQVYRDEVPLHEEMGYPIDTVKDSDLMLPARKALNELVNQLLSEEKEEVKEDKIIRVWFEVYLTPSSEGILLRDCVEEINGEYKVKEEYYNTLLTGYIARKYEEIVIRSEQEFSIKVSPSRVEGKPGTLVEIKVEIKPLKGENFKVELEASAGELESSKGVIPFSTNWVLEMPEEKMEYWIKARADGNIKEAKVVLVPRTDIEEVSELKPEHKGSKLLGINGIKDLGDFERIPEHLEGYATGELTVNEPSYHVEFDEIELGLLREFIKPVIDFRTVLELNVSVNMDIKPNKEIVIDDWWIEALRPLNRKVIFKIKRGDDS